MLPNGKDLIGTPWEMEIVDDLLIRRKQGSVYGYSSVIVVLPEMKVGKQKRTLTTCVHQLKP